VQLELARKPNARNMVTLRLFAGRSLSIYPARHFA
jgi:hypothetical protein